MRLEEARRDFYRKLARERGFRSRAAFKLLELNRRYSLLKQGQTLIDFGCAPGGWLQVASRAVGEKGHVIGIDLRQVVKVSDNVLTMKGDVRDPEIPHKIIELIRREADVILSDISPDVAGIWDLDHHKQIDLTRHIVAMFRELLANSGNAALKVFEGEAVGELRRELSSRFREVRIAKPKASRSKSSELYLVCLGFGRASSKPYP